ncbi:MAG: AAA family ATPase [Propionibacteriaceae bacterium]|jgi:MinD-like ATPase involved in chromosome partitioning or flagellar assembly|nr:AAA family ATPase [Propionibacteriaceae bacterium]
MSDETPVHAPSGPPPACAVFLRSNGTGEVLINKDTSAITCPDIATGRREAIAILTEAATRYGAPLLVTCSDPEGLFRLVVNGDGTVTEAPRDPIATPPTAFHPVYTPPVADVPAPIPFVNPAPPVMDSEEDDEELVIPGRRAFTAPSGTPLPAEQGWRGALARRGIPVPPSEAELADRAARLMVARHWPMPKTIAVVNGKGGAGKTPTTICLAAVFGRFGGSGILAWDNNQTRGTLGWRTETSPHEATLLDLLPEVPRLLSPSAQATELTRFVHHQSHDLYDVLRSKSVLLADEQRITPENVDAIWRVATKFYRLIIMDSGNDESDPMWRRMIDRADQLVTVTTTRVDHAEAGALLLEALMRRNEHSARLAQQSVTIITQADIKATEESIRRIRVGYTPLCRNIAFIPYDPNMLDGPLLYDNLRPATQRAWLHAAAAVAEGL